MFKFDDKQLMKHHNRLQREIGPGLVKATQWTINNMAKRTQFFARDNLAKNFTVRNTWTKRGIVRTETLSTKIDSMESRAGSREEYMKRQEEGFTNRAKGEGVPIQTGFSAGQEGANPRTKVTRKRYRMGNLKLSERSKTGSKRQRNARTIASGLAKKERNVFLELSRGRKGMFRLKGRGKSLQVKMIHDMSRKSTKVKPTLWLRDATNFAEKHLAEDYGRALRFQLRRAGAKI